MTSEREQGRRERREHEGTRIVHAASRRAADLNFPRMAMASFGNPVSIIVAAMASTHDSFSGLP